MLRESIHSLPSYVIFGAATIGFLGIYFSFAHLSKLITARLLKAHPDAALVVNTGPKPGQVRREIRYSVVSIAIFGVYGVLAIHMEKLGWVEIVWAPTPGYMALEVVVLTLWNEFHFWLCHRLLHFSWLYKKIHYVHHLSIVPTPYATYSFHWVEAVLLGSVMVIVMLFFNISVFGILFLPLLSLTCNIIGHWNTKLGWLTAATVRHSSHHKYVNGNYGFLLPIFDKVFGTQLERSL